MNSKKLEVAQQKLLNQFQQSVLKAIELFKKKAPDFHCCHRNAYAIVRFIDEHKFDPAETESYALAYRVLQHSGWQPDQHVYTKTKQNKFVCPCRTNKLEA